MDGIRKNEKVIKKLDRLGKILGKGETMETAPERLPAYTMEQITDIAVREASKMIETVQRYETRYERVAEHLEDLAGAFVLGALEATKKINPEISGGRGYQYSSGRGKMLHRLNEIKAETSSDAVSLQTVIGDGEEGGGEETTLANTLEDEKSDNPAALLWDSIDREAAGRLLSLLDEKQRAIMVARYVEDKPQYQVAEEMGLSAGRISQIESEAKEIMRKAWAA
jgi:RNA polymerase sigma factor (sigma-70 family)